MEFIDYHSKAQSINLSETRGKFKGFDESVYARPDYLYNKYKGKSAGVIIDEMWKDLDNRIAKSGIRNAQALSLMKCGKTLITELQSQVSETLPQLALHQQVQYQ